MRTIALLTMLATVAAPLAAVGAENSGLGDASAGEQKAAQCAACHGPDGNSTNPEWPKLAGQNGPYIAKQLADLKAAETRTNQMMAAFVANMSAQDMADIGAWYETQTATVGAADPELVELGEEVYRAGNPETGLPACMACHGPRGTGNGPAAWPALSGQHAPYTASQLRAFKSGARSNDPNGMMREIASMMSEQEIEAVSQYTAGLH